VGDKILATYSKKNRKKLAEQWENFQKRGGVEYGSVHDFVVESWKRSKEYGVDSGLETTPAVSKKELKRRIENRRYLLEIAVPYLKKIYEFMQGVGGIVAISDEDGVVLEAFGDYDSFSIPSAPFPGSKVLEKYIGTNGIGTSIHEDRALQIWSSEHYLKELHIWGSSAETIHDQNGNIIGCLNLTAPWDRVENHTLAMVAATAGAIERELKIDHVLKEKIMAMEQQKAMLELINEGIVVIDTNQFFVDMNNQAGMMLGVEKGEIIGTPIGDTIISGVNFHRIITEGKNEFDKEVSLKLKDRIFHGNVSTALIRDEAGNIKGAVITINESLRVNKLVNRMTGANAYFTFNDIIGTSEAIKNTIKVARAAAKSRSNVLILGETGTGKELFAQSIHNASSRRESSFVAVNCGAIPRNLVESELFGYVGGAFTGSKKDGHPGKFELADGGTIFLDEIGEMPIEAQVTLLRVLQNSEVVRVGGAYSKKIDVRVIAATNRDLMKKVEEKRFREDLFYRLNVLTVSIPQLRVREGDVKGLVNYFIRKLSKILGKNISSISEDALAILESYEWPGNIRELENVLERAVNIADTNEIRPKDLPDLVSSTHAAQNTPPPNSLKSKEYEHIKTVLEETSGNLRQTSKKLGIARSTLYLKLKKYGLSSSSFR